MTTMTTVEILEARDAARRAWRTVRWLELSDELSARAEADPDEYRSAEWEYHVGK